MNLPTTPPSTDAYVVIGNPIAHSRSPAIHQRFAALTGQAIDYRHCLSPIDGFAATIATLQQHGVRGCNVTVPFKAEAAQRADVQDARVALAGAANTLVLHGDGRIEAFNTDGIGLVRDITLNAGHAITARHALMLGAGGAAAGALAELIQARPATLTVANRNAARAQALVASHAALAAEHGVPLRALALDADALADAELPPLHLVINATASSLQGAALPITPIAQRLAPGALVYDMMYGPAARGFLDALAAAAAEVHTRDGLGMLVEQAAESFTLWRGVRPPAAQVLAELRAQLDAP